MGAASLSRRTAWMVALSSCLMTSALAEGTAKFANGSITVEGDRVSITLLPEMLPPSTTKASFDQKKSDDAPKSERFAAPSAYMGSHVEVTWEPTLNTPLARTVVLEPGEWQLSFFATPLQHPTDPFSDVSWSFFRNGSTVPKLETAPKLVVCAFRRVTSDSKAHLPPDRCDTSQLSAADAKGWARIQISASQEPLLDEDKLIQSFGNRGEVSTPLPSFSRSFSDNAERAATDLAQAVADVALERLESAAIENVRRQVLKAVCTGQLERLLDQAFVSASRANEPIPTLLKRTCAALETIRLQELATGSGLGLQQSLKQDMATLGDYLVNHVLTQCLKNASEGRPEHCPFLGVAKTDERLVAALGGLALLFHLAMEPEESVTALPQAQLMVKQLVDHSREMALLEGLQGRSQIIQKGLVIAGAAIAFCHSTGSCDSHTMRRFLDDPTVFIDSKHFKFIQDSPEYAEYQQLKGRLLSIVAHGVAIMSPQSRQDTRHVTLETSAMLFEILELTTEARCQRPETKCEKELLELREMRRMTEALLRKDVSSALVAVGGMAALRLVQEELDPKLLQRQTKYIGALSGYLNSYYGTTAGGQPLGPEEQRKLRRQAINSLVDLASDRTQKAHELTWALTVTPGMRGFSIRRGPSSHRNEKNWVDFGVHLSLPLGVTGEYVLNESTGVATNIFLLDLGQYSATQFGQKSLAKADAWSALSPGVGLGVIHKNWTFMLDGRYSPGWRVPGTRYELRCEDGAAAPCERMRLPVDSPLNNTWTFGLTIGYQVPLLRFD